MRLEAHGEHVRAVAGAIGIGLCVVVLGWIMVVARRAVRELDDSDQHGSTPGYLSDPPSPATSAPPSPRFRPLSLDSFAVDSTVSPHRPLPHHGHERRPSLQGGFEEAEVGLSNAGLHVHPLTALERTRLELLDERIGR